MYRPRHKVTFAQRLQQLSGHREVRVAGIVLIGVLSVVVLTLIGFRMGRQGVLPNVEVGGVAVGGMDEAMLRRTIQDLAASRADDPVTVVRSAVGSVPARKVSAVPEAMGFSVDVDATVRSVLGFGRQINPFSALTDQVRATFGTVRLPVVQRVDAARFEAWVGRTAKALATPPDEGDLTFDGTTVIPVPARAGAGVEAAELRQELPRALSELDTDTVTLVGSSLPPTSTPADLEALKRQAEQVLSGTIRLTRGSKAIVLTPAETARVLIVEPVASGSRTILRLAADPARLAEVAAKDVPKVESDPVDAQFRVSGSKVKVVASKKGFRFHPNLAAAQIVAVGMSADRRAALDGDRVDADLTTEEARALHITKRVSSFTTYHPCCQPRVQNIHTIADAVSGTIVLPHERYSLNEAIGERTPQKGYVEAPGITDGKFVDQLGGGISQFTTTLYNAIFFGGYHFEAYKAHSYYFTRYPVGREATLSWPTPDLAFTNDSDAGILMVATYTDTSVTVTFYGRQPVRVETTTGDPYNYTDPPTECEENPDLAKGASERTQEGSQGFDILVTRTLRYPDGTSKTEKYFTHYKAEPIIYEQRSCAGFNKGNPTPTPVPSPSP
jgi:vancomycin resistance protein YoaR